MSKQRSAKDVARTLLEAHRRAGLGSSPEAIVSQIEQLQRGIPSEDEFAALCVWSGRCSLIHRLGQEQFPASSKGAVQVPDFLVVFEFEGKPLPALVEVKTTGKRDTLKFTSAYREKLVAYGSAVGLPLLIAWRAQYGIWSLFDVGELVEGPGGGWKVEFPDIVKQSLMGLLLGDFTASMKAGIGLTIQIRREREVSKTSFIGRITAAHWHDPQGNPVHDLAGSFLPLLFALPVEVDTEVDGEIITEKFYIPADSGVWSQSAMAASLLGETEPNWLEVLQSERLKGGRDAIREAAVDAMNRGMIAWIGDIEPQKRPPYLPKFKSPKKKVIKV